MIGTSIEQSKHLMKLGLRTNTADMLYREWKRSADGYDLIGAYEFPLSVIADNNDIPAWSVSAMVKLIPESITIKDGDVDWVSKEFRISMEDGVFTVGHDFGARPVPHIGTQRNVELATALYKYVVWLLENNHIAD